MHDKPVPVGGGWAIIPLALAAWIAFFWPIEDKLTWVVLSSTLALALLSWVDDRRHLPQLTRLAVQVMAITLVLTPAARRQNCPFQRTGHCGQTDL